MSQSTSSYERRIYKGERYLRSEHLLRGGKFVAVTWTIGAVVHDCPAKKIGAKAGDAATTMMPGLEFVEAPGYVLGLCKTNESVVSMVTGEGHWSRWVGKKIQVVVRLIEDKKLKVDVPAIRVWSDKKINLGRVRDQMGRAVDDKWYAENSMSDAPPKPETDDAVVKLLAAMDRVVDQAGLDALSPDVSKLWGSIGNLEKSMIKEKTEAVKQRLAATKTE